jgi:hypothetical protein
MADPLSEEHYKYLAFDAKKLNLIFGFSSTGGLIDDT